eukprot:c18165_g1_i1 orf=907-1455(+)
MIRKGGIEVHNRHKMLSIFHSIAPQLVEMRGPNTSGHIFLTVYYLFAILFLSAVSRSRPIQSADFSDQRWDSRSEMESEIGLHPVRARVKADHNSRLKDQADGSYLYLPKFSNQDEKSIAKLQTAKMKRSLIGSSPPTCTSKCQDCTPCITVVVPIHSVTTFPNEYYAEAWRCQCNDTIYNP